MKTFFFALAFAGAVLTVQPAAAQTVFAPTGAEWTFQYFAAGSAGFSGRGAVRYAATRDTVVLGRTCRVLAGRLSEYDAAVPNSPVATYILPNEFFAVDGDRILYYHQTAQQFYTWVDFSAQPGDSWPVRAAASCTGGLGALDTAVVDSVGTIQVAGQTLRWVKLQPNAFQNSFTTGLYQYGQGRIVERLGHLRNLVPGGYCGNDPDIADGLACYSDNSGFQFSTFGLPGQGCASILLAAADAYHSFPQGVSVTPNPSATGEFRLEGLAEAPVSYAVFDAQGRRVRVGQLTSTTPELNLSDLPAGLYLLRGHVAGRAFSQRLVRE